MVNPTMLVWCVEVLLPEYLRRYVRSLSAEAVDPYGFAVIPT
jgi:hypothetical protein